MSWVWDEGPKDPTERFLLLAMADIADDKGLCWPSVGTVADRCCMSERNARRVIRKLELTGWVMTETQPGRNHSNRYTITKPDTAMSARTICPPGHLEHENRTNYSIKPDTAMSAEPSRTVKEPSIINTGEVIDILSEVVSVEMAVAFVAHRAALKSKLTATAARLLVGKLRGVPDADGAMSESIQSGWKGVFPKASQGRHQKPKSDLDAAFAQFGIGPSQ